LVTNRNLAERIAEGAFREGLFYRLNVYPVNQPVAGLPGYGLNCDIFVLILEIFLRNLAFALGSFGMALGAHRGH